MPEPSLSCAVRQLQYTELNTSLAELQREGRTGELHCIDPRAGTQWHTFADAIDAKNSDGQLQQRQGHLTQNAVNTFAEMAARWLDPTYALKGIGGITCTALETMQSPSRKVPSWAKDAFSFYIEYYNAKLSGVQNPNIAIQTSDPIAQQAIRKFLARKDEFSFSEARQLQAQQNAQTTQAAFPTLSPLTAIYPLPSLSGPAANCHRRRQTGRTPLSDSASSGRSASLLNYRA